MVVAWMGGFGRMALIYIDSRKQKERRGTRK